jgi:flagellin-like hook-associated protein FlgL
MTVNSVTQSSINTDRMLSLRSQLDSLQRQLGTGMRADNYADLGSVRSTSLEFRAERAALDGYQEAIQRTEVTFAIMSETLERLDGIASEMKGDAIPTSFVIQNGDRTTAQVSAEFRFYETVTLLNTDVEGQFLFSGLAGDTKPVAPAADIMEGVGARDGFKQVLDERQLADLGGSLTDPLLTGRLDLATVGAVTSITEAGGDAFGFQLDTVAGASSSSASVTTTGPSGAPEALSFEVTGPVAAGETVRFAVTMPDGTRQDITLTAADSWGDGENVFQVDPNPAATAANLGVAIRNAIDDLARTDLAAASAVRAGHDFFDNNPPLRVVPDVVNGIAGATSTVADATNTVVWYQGEDGPLDARLTNTTRVDDGVQVAYGARANEDALRTTLRELAVFSAQSFDVDDPSAANRYTQVAGRTRDNLDDPSGGTLPRSIALEVGTASTLMEATKERHIATRAVYNDILEGTDGITQEEVAAKLLNIQTRLEATYSVTAMLRELSLVNYLR